jgi:dihydroorotate dehydrogenase electron transfer subunit
MPVLIEKPALISTDHYVLKIDTQNIISHPGQFVNIKTGFFTDPLLRRPFSIHNQEGNIIEIVIRVIGRGTSILSGAVPGPIDIIAPLGNGFSIIENGSALLIGGGVGNAPLYYLSKKLREKGSSITYLFGSGKSEYVFLRERYMDMSDHFILATDDGSEGFKGYITECAGEVIKSKKFDFVYACGPSVMMKKITELLAEMTVPVEVSLENYFGCGIGLCSGCTVEAGGALKRACVNGPVFDGRLINWGSIY